MKRKLMLVLVDTLGRVLLTKQNEVYGLPSGEFNEDNPILIEACKLIKVITKVNLVMCVNMNICIQEDTTFSNVNYELFECKVHENVRISSEHAWVSESNIIDNLNNPTKLFLSSVFDTMKLALHDNSKKLDY